LHVLSPCRNSDMMQQTEYPSAPVGGASSPRFIRGSSMGSVLIIMEEYS
jgi:hypothetical protein